MGPVLNKHIVNIRSRDVLATQDIEGAQPDPYKTRERTKRFNRHIRKLTGNKGYIHSLVNGKYSGSSAHSDEDYSTISAYANHIERVQPMNTKAFVRSKRYYKNRHKNNLSHDFRLEHPLDDYLPEEDEGESEQEEILSRSMNNQLHNEDYGHMNNFEDYFQPGRGINTPRSRAISQEREMNRIMNEDIPPNKVKNENHNENAQQSYLNSNIRIR